MNQREPIQPSLWYSTLAIPFLLGGAALMTFLVFAQVRQVRDSMSFMDIPGDMDLNLKRDFTYTIFLERVYQAGQPFAAFDPQLHCEVHDEPYGAEIPIKAPHSSVWYNLGDRHGVAYHEFHVPRDGVYSVSCVPHRTQASLKLRIGVGTGGPDAIASAALKGLLAFGAGAVVALLIFLRVLMLRDQSRREIRAAGNIPV